jgi:3-hydroxyacyl-[acyl-carrier-protein] dehydratase
LKRFVDRIVEMTPGETIRATKEIETDDEIFEVHFPGFPVVPGTFLTEMMAQTAGKCLDAEKRPRGVAVLARIKSAAFRDYVGPGKLATIDARIRTNRESFAVAESTVTVDDKVVCSAEMLFAFVSLQRLAADYRDEVLERYWSEKGA